jgi:predicted dithiol-disulfide oxidoreductase (DUF899 family)
VQFNNPKLQTEAVTMTTTKTVSREEWTRARLELLAREKELTRLRDEVAEARMGLPRVATDKDYVFQAADGPVGLGELFDGRTQLIVYHFMFGPEWQEGCPSCSYLADHFDGATAHLNARDVTLVAISRGPIERLLAYRKRMGWKFTWVSSLDNDFNFDFNVSFPQEMRASGPFTYNYREDGFVGEEAPGLSIFKRDEDGGVYHTYSRYSRGLDDLIGTYQWLDLVPKGRDEEGLDFSMAWVRRHDCY